MAMSAFAGLWRHYAPGGRRRLAVRVGCLLFATFITLFVWLVQGMIWMVRRRSSPTPCSWPRSAADQLDYREGCEAE
jgi:hypothetical protein